jgi:hypothetical protein
MIAEGLLTTTDTDGNINVAPMGPIVRDDFQRLTLRPFSGSTTFNNLLATKTGVFHIVDRVNIIAEAAIRRLKMTPENEPAKMVDGFVLDDCCRWFELHVTSISTTDQRSVMECDVVHTGERRPFWGFNRARHAVIEAAILATRLHLLKRDEVESQMKNLKSAVDKTGGTEELSAFKMLSGHMEDFYAKEIFK